MKINLKNALACKRIMEARGMWRGHKIGMVKKTCDGLGSHAAGSIVIYHEDYASEQDRARKRPPTLCIEMPMSEEQIAAEEARGSLLTTICAMVCVPPGHIEEVQL